MTSLLGDSFLAKALAAGLGVAIIAGVTGCFVVWRRMAYFGDSLAHSALLGVVLGLAIGVGANFGTVVVCITFATLLLLLQHRKLLATDTLLGILAHAALSISLVAMSLLQQNINLHAYLFGDILTVSTQELWLIYGGGAVALMIMLLNWSSLVLMTVCEDLAVAENVKVLRNKILLMLVMTIVVAVSIRIVGILLISSMLIIPAAAARQLTRSPESMAATSAVLGMVATVAGLHASVQLDTPSGPTIVATAAALFVAACVAAPIIQGRHQA